MTPSLVSHVKAEYGPGLPAALERACEPLGGFGALVHPGERIGVKVNLLRAAAPEARLVCFGSHVDEVSAEAARAAGADVVLPRSKFFRDPNAAVSPSGP